MDERDWLADRFEAHRGRLRAVAYRMLGSLSEADDAVQETWLRLHRADIRAIENNMGGWLTTVVARLCLDMLRSRKSRREEPLDTHLPDPIIGPVAGLAESADPERETLLADSVGLALLVVLDTLAPAERLAFVLHDIFDVPFDEIAPIVERSPAAARQLASRARRRVHGSTAEPDADLSRQRAAVEAFLVAARDGDFDALIAVLDPDVVLRADLGATPAPGAARFRGARTVAEQAMLFAWRAALARPALVNGAAGLVVATGDRPIAVMAFTVRHSRIAEIDILADPVRLRRLDLASND